MRLTLTIVVTALLLVSEASAAMLSPQHATIARRINRKKRCVERGSSNNSNNNNNNVNVNNVPSSSTSAGSPPAETPNSNPQPPPPQSGTINAYNSPCGDPRATTEPTQLSGPNGHIDWLNCGLEGEGWRPPSINLGNLIYKDLRTVLSWGGNPFDGCSPYIDIFEQAARDTGVPSIIFASIAMQESSCRPPVTGPNGEVGMMQITPDKCGGVPDCYDPGTNVGIAARYFKSTLDNNGGNLAITLGAYNGWEENMTIWQATNRGSCRSQNNLDYLLHVFDGYLQGVSPASIGQGKYNNLANC